MLYRIHYDTCATFKKYIDACLRDFGSRFNGNKQTLVIVNFQLFSKTESCAV